MKLGMWKFKNAVIGISLVLIAVIPSARADVKSCRSFFAKSSRVAYDFYGSYPYSRPDYSGIQVADFSYPIGSAPKTDAGWIKAIKSDFSKPEPARVYSMYTRYAALIDKMTTETRQVLLEFIAQEFPSLEKDSDGTRFSKDVIPPRRAANAWLRSLLNGKRIFENAFNKTGNTLQSYQAYFDVLNREFISKNPRRYQERGYGTVQAETLLEIAKIIQTNLKSRKYADQHTEASVRKTNPIAYLTGSATDGLSKRGSDLDIQWTGPDELWLREDWVSKTGAYNGTNLNTKNAGLQVDLNKWLSKFFPDFFDISEKPHPFYIPNFVKTLILQTFVIEITPKEINLLVFPMPRVHPDGSINTVAPLPDRYPLQ